MASPKDGNSMRLQVGALPYRVTETGQLQLLLITSRTTHRWIIPKGWPMKGLKAAEAAAQEAFEEAGIRGKVTAKPIGSFVYKKLADNGVSVPCEVTVFPLLVKRRLKEWPEMAERESRWVDPCDVSGLIAEPELVTLISAFVERIDVSSAA